MVVQVKLVLNKKNDADLATWAGNVVNKMTGNANFPTASVTPTLAVVTTANNALILAINNKGKGKASTQAVKQARFTVETFMTQLGAYVQGVANGVTILDINRVGIVLSAGMDVRAFTPRQKQVFAAFNGDLSGTADLRAPGIDRGSHEWQITTANPPMYEWVNLTATIQAFTQVTNLTPGAPYGFRHRFITKDGPTEWSDPILLLIK